jgi:Uma2 family endonuclease
LNVSRLSPRFTRSDYDLLPEGFPAQLVNGCLVREPAPTYGHQRVAQALNLRLAALVDSRRVVCAPIDVGLDQHNVYQPDIVVLPHVPPDSVRDVGVPLLAIEVLSPSTARRDRRVKLPRLLAAGTREVWIVDPVAQSVEVHDAAGCRSVTGGESLASNVIVGFHVSPSDLFPPPAG